MAVIIEMVKPCLLVMMMMAFGQLMMVDGQPTIVLGVRKMAEDIDEDIDLEEVIFSRLLQQMESMMSRLNDRFDGLENKLNNVVETLSEVKQKQLETSQQTCYEMENATSVLETRNQEQLQQINTGINNVLLSINQLQYSRKDQVDNQVLSTITCNHLIQLDKIENSTSQSKEQLDYINGLLLNINQSQKSINDQIINQSQRSIKDQMDTTQREPTEQREKLLNNITSAIDVIYATVFAGFTRQAMTSQNNHVAQLNKIDNVVSYIEAKNEEQLRQINNTINTVLVIISQSQNNLIENLNSTRLELTQNQVKLVENISSLVNTTHTNLFKELTSQATTSQSNHVDQLIKIENITSMILAKNEEVQEFCVNNVTKQLLALTKEISTTTQRDNVSVQNISDSTSDVIDHDVQLLKPVHDVIGNSSTSLPDDVDHMTSNQGPTPVLTHSVPGNEISVLAVALFGEELFVTRFGDVSVYNATSLQLIRRIRIPGLGEHLPGLSADPVNNCLYVSDWDNRQVHRVDLSTNIITSWDVDDKPYGLSVNREHNVLVASWFASIREHTSNGTLVRRVSHDNSVWQAIQTRNGTLVVSHYYHPKHEIAEMTWDGHVLRSYGNQSGSGEGQMNHPRSLAVDWNGYILVADKANNRIQVVNPSLTAARTLPLNIEINSPYALCYDESRGRLYVGEYSGHKRVLAFDHVTNLDALFN